MHTGLVMHSALWCVQILLWIDCYVNNSWFLSRVPPEDSWMWKDIDGRGTAHTDFMGPCDLVADPSFTLWFLPFLGIPETSLYPVSNSSSLSPPADSPSIPALRLLPVSFVQAVPLPPVALSKPVAPALRTDSESLSASVEGQGLLHWG